MRITLLSALVLCLMAAVGCRSPQPIAEGHRGHVLILPGIGGELPSQHRLKRMIDDEVKCVMAQVWDWTDLGFSTPLGDLVDLGRNRRRAQDLADELLRWRCQNVDSLLYLVATSGGAGIVLFACEALPEDFQIERVVFISPALSPGVDLSPVLLRSRKGLFNYYSGRDVVILGAGTWLFGTTDRRHGASAGLVGFEEPVDAALAGKLEQLPWDRSMIRLGNLGGHTGGFATGFVRKHLLPLFELPSEPGGQPSAGLETLDRISPAG
jgi:hypothetical protein